MMPFAAIALITHIGDVVIAQLQRVAITFILRRVFGRMATKILDVLIVVVALLVYASVIRLMSWEALTCSRTLSATASYKELGLSSDRNWYLCHRTGGGVGAWRGGGRDHSCGRD